MCLFVSSHHGRREDRKWYSSSNGSINILTDAMWHAAGISDSMRNKMQARQPKSNQSKATTAQRSVDIFLNSQPDTAALHCAIDGHALMPVGDAPTGQSPLDNRQHSPVAARSSQPPSQPSANEKLSVSHPSAFQDLPSTSQCLQSAPTSAK